MKIFISWSEPRSHSVAKALDDWLRFVFRRTVNPWISSRQIDSGTIAIIEIVKQLKDSNFGILCLTAESVQAPWILFEAGALTREMDGSNVVPYCIGINHTQIGFPLAHFQARQATKEGTFRLFCDINKRLANEHQLDERDISKMFDDSWNSTMQSVLDNLPESSVVRKRPADELIEETLSVVRGIANDLYPVPPNPITGISPLAEAYSLNAAFNALHQVLGIDIAGFSTGWSRSAIQGRANMLKSILNQVAVSTLTRYDHAKIDNAVDYLRKRMSQEHADGTEPKDQT